MAFNKKLVIACAAVLFASGALFAQQAQTTPNKKNVKDKFKSAKVLKSKDVLEVKVEIQKPGNAASLQRKAAPKKAGKKRKFLESFKSTNKLLYKN